MSLSLRIENVSSLPDGGPLTHVLTGSGGADIGRDTHLDWTLPDESRHISGKHCEIRPQDAGYLLYDVSANGTFVNGASQRVQSPYRLRSGDRLTIGDYIIRVDIAGEAAPEGREAPQAAGAAPPFVDLWGADDEAAPPLDPRDLRPAEQSKPIHPDFLEWAVDVPNSPGGRFRRTAGRARTRRRTRAAPPALGGPGREAAAPGAGGGPQPYATPRHLGEPRTDGAVGRRCGCGD